MANEEEDFTEQDRQKIISRATALVLRSQTALEELMGLMDALRTAKKKSTKDLDENGDPTFKFTAACAIPKNIRLTKRMKQYALDKGFNASTVNPVWEEFVNYYQRTGKKWVDWYAVWQKWVRTQLERNAAGGGPRTSRDLPEL